MKPLLTIFLLFACSLGGYQKAWEFPESDLSNVHKVAIYRGSFDPLHKGHVSIIEECLKRGIDHVFLFPAFGMGEKKRLPLEIRTKMLQEFAKGWGPSIQVFTFGEEDDLLGVRAKVMDWVQALQKQGIGVYKVLGGDAVYDEVKIITEKKKEMDGYALASRKGYPMTEEILQPFVDSGYDVLLIQPRSQDLSSSEIRYKIIKGESVSEMVPYTIDRMIRKYDLYQEEVKMSQLKLSGKKAVITGGSRSIGRAVALTFASEGADVVVSYQTNKKGAEDTVAAIEKLGRKAKAIPADFTTLEGVEEFYQKACSFLGEIDILVNNAAGYNSEHFFDLDPKTFNNLLHIGVSAPMLLTKLVANQMVEKHIEGSIINISSITGVRPYPERVGVATFKGALNMLTQSTALDLAPWKIRVNAIAPGSTPYNGDGAEEIAKTIPLKRAGTPEDQAKGALFLASKDSSWITGQILVIDGGHSLAF